MARLRFGISGGFDCGHIRRLHEAALRVVEEVGVIVSNPEILQSIAGQQGVKIDGQRVRLDAAMLDSMIDQYPNPALPDPDRPYQVRILSGYAFQEVDPFTDRLETMTTERCIQGARLVDTLHDQGVAGGTPGMPQDVPPQLREILACKISCENSRTGAGVGFTSRASNEYGYQLCQVVGKPFGVMGAFVLDPLRVEGEGVDLAWDFIKRHPEMALGLNSMPLLGVTTPLRIPAAFVEGLATVLAAYGIFRLSRITRQVSFNIQLFPFDMKFGTIAYGTPEHILCYLLGSQVQRYYGLDSNWNKAYHTNAIFADAHSLLQRGMAAALSALNGSRMFTYGGMLGIDKIFSAEQLILDVETVSYLKVVTDGVDFDWAAQAMEIISQVGPAGQFITHDSTIDHFRQVWVSDLMPNLSPEQWQAGEQRTVKDRVRERIRKLMASYDFCLDPTQRRELDRIYAAAVKELA